MRGFSLAFFLSLSLLASAGESFREFLEKELSGFEKEKEEYDRYLRDVEKEFQEYKRIVSEEFRRFKEEVIGRWGYYEASDKKKIVQYSKDLRVKRVFDFEKGELRIEVLGNAGRDTLEKELRDFISQTEREAFLSDRLLVRIERRVSGLKHVKRARLSDTPILAPLLSGKDAKALLKEGTLVRKTSPKGTITSFKVKVRRGRIPKRAFIYKPLVVEESEKHDLPPDLVFAIIHTESYFNPLATSPVPAYGLMQVVPGSAGIDATRFLFGKPYLLAPSFLYNPKNNIRIGTAYLHLLYYRYFKGVRDERSRLLCVIAAYNTGPGNVARAFTGGKDLSEAIEVINGLSYKEVLRTLLYRLPW
ncbi:MAG TPA: DUF3393 domain-containing protein [Aquificaceae bacterium]|nr:DUF3393 domain-containing protein [Aquificaceae bacterium]